MDAEIAPAVEPLARAPQQKVATHHTAAEDLMERDIARPRHRQPFPLQKRVVERCGDLRDPVPCLFRCHAYAPPGIEEFLQDSLPNTEVHPSILT
jgi:hypothetical protein